MTMCHFWVKKGSFAPNNFFLENYIILIYLLVPVDPELWWCAIFGPKMTHFPKWEFFFRKPVNEPCFFHSCLSTCQKSKSHTKLLVKYWRLKNIEISLTESHFCLTWEPDFPQACSFRRMLMNHKNFHLTQIPDKTNDVFS